jgi:dephospho-CoA kinase
LEADVFPKGKVDLQAIAAIIFNDAAKKRAFEALIHPLVWLAVEEKVDTEGVGKICIVESAIIYETGSEHMFTGIIVAACDSEEQFRRLKQNRGMGETNIRARLTQQLSSPEKETRADFVIHTDCEMEELKGRVENLHTVLKQRKGN